MLRRVGIPDPEHRVDHYPHQFSGGQKQRIVIAQALVLNPGLDHRRRADDRARRHGAGRDPRACCGRLPQEFGAAIVLITHNMGVVADLADRVAVMYDGEIVEQAHVADAVRLTSAPVHATAARRRPARRRRPAAGAGRSPDANLARASTPAARRSCEARGLAGRPTPGACARRVSPAVDGVDLRIGPGEVLGLVGESGSGKTTIGRAIAGLTPVTRRIAQGARRRDERGARAAVPARPQADRVRVPGPRPTSFNPLLTIAQCVAEPLVVHGVAASPHGPRARVDELLEAVQLPRALRRPVPARAVGRAAPARVARPCARARPRAAHRRRADLRARRVRAGARARPVRAAAVRARVRVPVHQPRPRRGGHARGPDRRAAPRRASSRRARATRCSARPSTRTRSGCSRRCPCPTRSSRPRVVRRGRRPAREEVRRPVTSRSRAAG